MGSSWPCRQTDLLEKVGKLVRGNLRDFVKMGAVCKKWREFFVKQNWMGCGPMMEVLRGVTSSLHHPKLMLPARQQGENNDSHEFLVDWRTDGRILIPQPQLNGIHICGSGYGWLVTEGLRVELNDKYGVELLNPITKEHKMLPFDQVFQPLPMFESEVNIKKAIIIGNPSETKNCTIAACIESHLFWLTDPGVAKGWMRGQPDIFVVDIEHHNGLLYAIADNFDRLEVWDLGTAQRLRILQDLKPHPFVTPNLFFTFQCLKVSGVLMAVITLSSKLAVYELNEGVEEKRPPKWVPVTDLGDRSLFVGKNSSMALSPVLPTSGFRTNCVYFTDHQGYSVYDMRDRSCEAVLLDQDTDYAFTTWLTFNPDWAAW